MKKIVYESKAIQAVIFIIAYIIASYLADRNLLSFVYEFLLIFKLLFTWYTCQGRPPIILNA